MSRSDCPIRPPYRILRLLVAGRRANTAGQYAKAEELFKLAIDLDGTLTGEHGIGLSKAPYMDLEHDPVAMDVMRTLKKTFDPNNILNPGKMALEE